MSDTNLAPIRKLALARDRRAPARALHPLVLDERDEVVTYRIAGRTYFRILGGAPDEAHLIDRIDGTLLTDDRGLPLRADDLDRMIATKIVVRSFDLTTSLPSTLFRIGCGSLFDRVEKVRCSAIRPTRRKRRSSSSPEPVSVCDGQ